MVFNDDGANYDFRIEGDTNANLFFVDASAEAVGIGTGSPVQPFEVVTSTGGGIALRPNAGNATQGLLWYDTGGGPYGFVKYDHQLSALSFGTVNSERARIDSSVRLLVGTASAQGQSIFQAVGNSSASTDPGDIRVIRGLNVSSIGTNVGAELGIIKFGALEDSVCAKISAVCDANWGTNDYPGRLVFATTADAANSPTERMVLDSSGRVGIGTTSPRGRLEVSDGTSNTA